MVPIPWEMVREMVHFCGIILLMIWIIKLFMCIITEVCSRYCRHCGKKV